MKSTLATLFTGAALALSLTGCALRPQQIEVKPTAEVQPANRGNNQPVQVIAVDSRDRKEFGSRGGVYKDTSLVQPANDLRPAIAETVRQGLQTLGYNAFNPVGILPKPGEVGKNEVDSRHVIVREHETAIDEQC